MDLRANLRVWVDANFLLAEFCPEGGRHEPRVGSLFWWVDGDTGEFEREPQAVCKFCGDGYYLRYEDLAPGGQLDEWYGHERELIERGEWIVGDDGLLGER